MGYRLGVDVGGTFTDLALIDTGNGRIFNAKVPSTPADSSQGVLAGIDKICSLAGIDPLKISHVMHGTTVATNAVLTGDGARVGLITTRGFRQVLHISRSYIPGGLGGWVIYNKSRPMAPLKWTFEIAECVSAAGEVLQSPRLEDLAPAIERFRRDDVEAVTICLINSYTNGANEQIVREAVQQALPGVPVSISSEVIPEMQEYERAVTTVANSFVRPTVGRYVGNLKRELDKTMASVSLNILRSDGGLSSARASAEYPVNLLMSGPAGGVSGAIWIAKQAGFPNVITFDMGGTSTDVALVRDGVARLRRETTVGDVSVRASSVDVRTVGAGGGSIAHVPEITKALRVGPQSAGAVPGPAAYMKGGTKPTVTDANVVLGYLPESARLGGEMQIDRKLAEQAVQAVATSLDLPLMAAAAGIVQIVNENMFGALRLVSVEQGYDPRDFALICFGGAGPLHGNALGKLLGSWPVIVPRGPGVLCAYGDATTRLRDEATRTFIRRFADLDVAELISLCRELEQRARATLIQEAVPDSAQTVTFEMDVRYVGQALQQTLDFTMEDLSVRGLEGIAARFDDMHEQFFTFRLAVDHESINLRAVAQGDAPSVAFAPTGDGASSVGIDSARIGTQQIFADNAHHEATIYDRSLLGNGERVNGPAIITEMDSTTLILPGYHGDIDPFGNILIRPSTSTED